MKTRSFDPARREMMDCAGEPSPLLEQDLRNLERLNRWFGGHALVRKIAGPWLKPRGGMAVLDLACGAGDIARVMRRLGERARCPVRVTAVDANPAIITLAQRFAADVADIDFVVADAFTYTPPRPPAIVLCTLALHHFDRPDAVRLLARLGVLAGDSGRILVTDLRRSRSVRLGVWWLTTLWMRNRMTRHDARLSMQHAWSMDEVRELAGEAGWNDFHQCRGPWGRQALWR